MKCKLKISDPFLRVYTKKGYFFLSLIQNGCLSLLLLSSEYIPTLKQQEKGGVGDIQNSAVGLPINDNKSDNSCGYVQ